MTGHPLLDAEHAASERRHQPLRGLYNLRDTGGYPAASGASRWGKLFRSDALHRIDDAGRDRLSELGITRVIDLRGAEERQSSPSALDGMNLTVYHLPVFDDAAPAAQAAGGVALAPVYDHIVDRRGRQLAAAIKAIADTPQDEAVLVHCTAGKDRTGIVVAFALSAAGVERRAVVDDYAASEENLRGEWVDAMVSSFEQRGFTLTPDVLGLIAESPAPVLDTLIDRVEKQHGSVADYLLAHGLTGDDLTRLTAALVDIRTSA
ncbi:tyrosine-protein phosphatase [Microbacterium esteraromaticum]|uniref:tyrosine-protein phosphatase n=1 Tax=Microbacterium esteraromaticum TaxID=57043 RepID=UPI0023674B2A|nr:tyrosine-protein phosphatase [Microbacterium esteraromaticum]WDH78168.1 tyrosine-protein phosphatase [Microbacterium esteraromaticum]